MTKQLFGRGIETSACNGSFVRQKQLVIHQLDGPQQIDLL